MQITTLEQLEKAADDRKSVICPGSWAWGRPRPARFILNLSGAVLLMLFRSGMFIYTPKSK